MKGHRKTGDRREENGKVAELAEWRSVGRGNQRNGGMGRAGRVKGKRENLSVIPSKLNAQDLFGAVPQTAGAVMVIEIS